MLNSEQAKCANAMVTWLRPKGPAGRRRLGITKLLCLMGTARVVLRARTRLHAFGPSQHVCVQAMVLADLLPKWTKAAASLPAATARACLPYWLEAGGWAAALMLDATAAAMGRLPNTEYRAGPISSSDSWVRYCFVDKHRMC